MPDEIQPKNETPQSPGEATGETDPNIGRVLGGQYRIIEKLGQGAMGIVYRAEQSYIERVVAIKLLHSHLSKNDEYLKRFRREALIASKLTHPNAIRLYDFGVDDGCPYLAMQFAQGRSLKEILLEEGAFAPERLGEILRQVGGAVREAHGHGIIHRDLKPDNILISKLADGTEKAFVLDFGIAKPLEDVGLNVTASLTRAGFFIGTPQYMAPEQVMDRPLDARSDIYSIGVILYETLTGETPFKSDSPMEMMLKHINTVPVPVRDFKPQLKIPQRVSAVVNRALAKDPKDRYQTVAELVADFDAAIAHSAAAVRKSGERAKQMPAIAAGLLLALLVGGGVYFLTHQDEELQTHVAALTPGASAEPKQAPPPLKELPISKVEATTPTVQVPATTLPATAANSEITSDIPVDNPVAPLPVIEAPSAPPPIETTGSESIAATEAPVDETPATSPPEAPTESVTSTPPIETKSEPSDIKEPPTSNPPEDLIVELELPAEQAVDKRLTGAAARKEADRLFSEGEKILSGKDYINAGMKFRQALAYRNDHLGAHLSLGMCLLKLGRLESAYENFNAALALDKDYAPTHYNLASYYALKNDPVNSIGSLKRAITLYPKVKSWVKEDPDFDSIRSNPEFTKLIN